MSRARDDFSERVKVKLALRVAQRCSNPVCGRTTSGPRSNPLQAVKIGVAAHIRGAATGSARYDPAMSAEQNQLLSLHQRLGSAVLLRIVFFHHR